MKRIFTFLMMVAAFAAATSCGLEGGETTDDPNKDQNQNPDPDPDQNDNENTSTDLTISIDTPVIKADGQSAANITVKLGTEVLKSGVKFYDAKTDKPMSIKDFAFTTTEAGVYSFWASYKTFHTKSVTVTAITSSIPDLPLDKKPESTSFVKRVFINQFTGTGCGYCPNMIDVLTKFGKTYPDKYVLAACHTYNDTDPAYLDYSIDNAMSVGGYPCVVLNLDKTQKFQDYTKPALLKNMFLEDYGTGKVGTGIAVSTLLDGENIVIRAAMKVASEGKYRIGAWLLEDGIMAKQSGAGNDPIEHNNCVRDIYSKNTGTDYSGRLHIMDAGESAEEFFLATMNSKWNSAKCHVVVFVCAQKTNGNYAVVNVIDCPLGKSLSYEYAE